ncbi:hypothetical_protein_-_conserved [Leishmania infantum]|uniref:Hypothetical_protein_-_conserved n=1 Tax=Leishmania infantum TaxID=5671 RepID=A0A6L0WR28_LEIIN|nr:hypothetical_protein_-_conserved [Leishmania infantum]SUZ38595.1 hypothetical_protein_-_conserved [Leishmania infantum]
MAKTKRSHAPRQPHHSADPAAEAAPTPSFIVYPVPSIADASFLQIIFCNTVRRSLFLGFGRARFAVAELTSAAVAAEVETIIHKAAAAVAGPEDGAAASQEASGLAADAAARHGALEHLADDDAFEHMTLADLFAPPPGSSSQGSASAPRQERQPSSGGAAAGGESLDFSHIPYLVWRDRPVHVVVSGVRVADFYGSGGAVPEHHVKRTTDAGEPRSSTKPKRPSTGKRTRDDADSTAALSSSPAASQRAVAEERAQGSGAVDAAVVAAASTAPKSRFPKDRCQKCGSADHFTRHCDGSNGASVAAVVSPSVAVGVDKQPRHEALAAEVAAPTPRPAKAKPLVQRTSKDQCKYCGSEAHLSRHCPSKS